jgi:hypothetical protein
MQTYPSTLEVNGFTILGNLEGAGGELIQYGAVFDETNGLRSGVRHGGLNKDVLVGLEGLAGGHRDLQ